MLTWSVGGASVPEGDVGQRDDSPQHSIRTAVREPTVTLILLIIMTVIIIISNINTAVTVDKDLPSTPQ